MFAFSELDQSSRMSVREEHGDGSRVAVHHRFFAGPIADAYHSDPLILELDLVMLRVNSRWVISA